MAPRAACAVVALACALAAALARADAPPPAAGALCAAAFDGTALARRLGELARHGRYERGGAAGVDRTALGASHAAARVALARWAEDGSAGLAPALDEAGNLFLESSEAECDAVVADGPAVLLGSHLDSQPTGGRYDGVYGVLAALGAVEAMRTANVSAGGGVGVVDFAAEESSAFGVGTLGSRAWAAPSNAATLRATLRSASLGGITYGEAVDAHAAELKLGGVHARPLGARAAGARAYTHYLEAHIEQGPILETESKPVGVVSGIAARRALEVRVRGEVAHTGNTRRVDRRDAMHAAVRIAHAMYDATEDREELVRFTIGRWHVSPNSSSVVPESVTFSVDLRCPSDEVCDALAVRLEALTGALGGALVGGSVGSLSSLSEDTACAFDGSARAAVERAAEELSLEAPVLLSGALHDASYAHAAGLDTAMVFVRCEGGRSHTPDESAKIDDLIEGGRVLSHALCELITGASELRGPRGGGP